MLLGSRPALWAARLLIAETGAEGRRAAPYWLHHVCAEVFHAMDAGASIQRCLHLFRFSTIWVGDNDRSCEVGLLSAADEGGKRSVYTAVTTRVAQAGSAFRRSLPSPMSPWQRIDDQ